VNELYVVKWQRGNLLNKIVNSTNLAQWYSVFKSDDLCLLLKKELDRCVFKYPARPNGRNAEELQNLNGPQELVHYFRNS
jgi:hypothetical protein